MSQQSSSWHRQEAAARCARSTQMDIVGLVVLEATNARRSLVTFLP